MNHLLAFMGVGGWELTIVFVVILLLFGARRLPDLARGLGQSLREFKKATDDETATTTTEKNTAGDSKPNPTEASKTNP